MTKKIFYAGIIFSLLCFGACISISSILAKDNNKTAEPEPMELDQTSWEIVITPITSAPGKEPQTVSDNLIFEDKKFSSENFTNNGFDATNYSLSLKDDGATVCETMQTKDKDTIFWRMEVMGDGMKGIISKVYISENKSEDFRFSGKLTSGTLKPRVKRIVVERMPPEDMRMLGLKVPEPKPRSFWQRLIGKIKRLLGLGK